MAVAGGGAAVTKPRATSSLRTDMAPALKERTRPSTMNDVRGRACFPGSGSQLIRPSQEAETDD